MTSTVAGIHLGLDTHANRPAANTVPDGALYSCSDHGLVYKSNYAGNSWATWRASTAVTEILDIPTAETDDTLVLAPDGAGGVEFRAEAGGGGGGGTTVLGKTSTGASTESVAANRIICKKVTVPGAGTFLGVGARIKAAGAGQVLNLHAIVFIDNAGAVGQVIGHGPPQIMYLQTDAGGTIPAHTLMMPAPARAEAAGDYWIAVRDPGTNTTPSIYYDSGGSDVQFSANYTATGGTVFGQSNTTKNYDIWTPFLPD